MTVLRPGVLDDLDVSKGAGSEALLQSAIRKAALRFVRSFERGRALKPSG